MASSSFTVEIRPRCLCQDNVVLTEDPFSLECGTTAISGTARGISFPTRIGQFEFQCMQSHGQSGSGAIDYCFGSNTRSWRPSCAFDGSGADFPASYTTTSGQFLESTGVTAYYKRVGQPTGKMLSDEQGRILLDDNGLILLDDDEGCDCPEEPDK